MSPWVFYQQFTLNLPNYVLVFFCFVFLLFGCFFKVFRQTFYQRIFPKLKPKLKRNCMRNYVWIGPIKTRRQSPISADFLRLIYNDQSQSESLQGEGGTCVRQQSKLKRLEARSGVNVVYYLNGVIKIFVVAEIFLPLVTLAINRYFVTCTERLYEKRNGSNRYLQASHGKVRNIILNYLA